MAVIARSAFWTTFSAVTALLTAVQCSQPFALCDLECCDVWPSCEHALSIDCQCSREKKIHLRGKDVPRSVQHISIWDTPTVVIGPNITSDLQSLEWLSLIKIGRVTIKSEAMMLAAERKEFRSLEISIVDEVHFEASALTGYWKSNATIVVDYIDRLVADSNAFNFRTTHVGPAVKMARVKKLLLAGGSFTAEIGQFSMADVYLPLCADKSFGGNIRHLDFLRVQIDEAESGCVNGADTRARLSMRLVRLWNVRSGAFSGTFHDVLIDGSHIKTVHEKGFQLEATSLSINGSELNVIKSNGLMVSGSHSILLGNISARVIRRGAFKGLRTSTAPAGGVNPLIISKLSVTNAEDGSMAFADDVEIHLDDLDMRTSCSCPVDLWARQLVGAGSTGHLRQPQLEVLDQLRRQCDCPDVGTTESQTRPSATFEARFLTESLAKWTKWAKLAATSDAISLTQRLTRRVTSAIAAGSTTSVNNTGLHAAIGVLAAVLLLVVVVVVVVVCWRRLRHTPSAGDHLTGSRRPVKSRPPGADALLDDEPKLSGEHTNEEI